MTPYIPEYLERLFASGRLYDDFLESSFQRSVLLNALSVLVECGGTYALHLSSCQRGLEDIGGIHAAWCRTGTDKSVYLVYEYDDVLVGFYLTHQGFHAFLKLPAVFRSSHKSSEVEIYHPLII